MTNKNNKRFISTLLVMLLLFLAVIGGAGCGGPSGVISNGDNGYTEPEPTPEPERTPNPEPTPEPEPVPNPTPESESETVSFTLTFDSNGGTYVESQTILSGDIPIKPDAPIKTEHTFMGWYDDNDDLFVFDAPISEDTVLTADWAKTLAITYDEIANIEQVEFGGIESISFDNSPIVSLDVSYILDGAGIVDIEQITTGPLTQMTGIIGNPVDINIIGTGSIVSSEIAFGVDPTQLSSDVGINNLGIVWYDPSNDIVVLLSSDVIGNTVITSREHFSQYALVDTSKWLKLWETRIPEIRTDNNNYNVFLLLDTSGSMSGIKMTKTIEAAQDLIDRLADDDYVTVGAFDSYLTVLELANSVKRIKLVDQGHDYRQEIKNWLGNLRASGGTDIAWALQYALNNNVTEENYESIIILLSDGQSYVSDSLLQSIKNAGMEIISVGVGNDVSESLMKKLADNTDGQYIYAEEADELNRVFDKIGGEIIGISPDDNDGDGLEDALEKSGMKDQYNVKWYTNSDDKDTDGDKIIDGAEMGRKVTVLFWSHFERVSNPRLTTKHSDQAYVTVADSMLVTNDALSKSLMIDIEVTDWRYFETSKEETFYQPASNLRIELLNRPSNLSMKKQPEIVDRKTVNAFAGSEKFTYRTVLSYAGTDIPDYAMFSWKITADNMKAIEKKTLFNHNRLQVYNGVYHTATVALSKVATNFVDELMGGANQKASVSSQLSRVKSVIKASSGTATNEVYEAFALAILDSVGVSNIDSYESDPAKLTNQIATQIRGGLSNGDGDVDVTVGKITYNVHFNIYAISGIFAGFADVKRGSRTVAHLTATNYGTEDGALALAEYCAALAQLNNDVWKDFMACYISDAANLIGVTKITKQNARKALDHIEGIIKALSDSEHADEIIAKMGKEAQKEFGGWLWDTSSKKLRTFIKKNIPGGNNLIDNVDKLNTALNKYGEYEKEVNEYAALDKNTRDSSAMKKAYQEFKTAYDQLNGIDIFKNFVPVAEWPKDW